MSKIKFYTSEDQVYFEMEEEKVNKEQKIQELSNEIDRLKKELEELQKKPYKISYPKDEVEMYYIDDYTGELEEKTFDIFDDYDKRLYEIGLLFNTKKEAEQFLKEQTLIKKIKCWAKEQQGDWEPDWSDINQCKYCVNIDRFIKEIICECCWGCDKLSKLPHFKTEEIAQACIDEFGNEILEVFC